MYQPKPIINVLPILQTFREINSEQKTFFQLSFVIAQPFQEPKVMENILGILLLLLFLHQKD